MNSKQFADFLRSQIKNPAQTKDVDSMQSRYGIDDLTWEAIRSGNWGQVVKNVDCTQVLTHLTQQAFEADFVSGLETRPSKRTTT